MTRAAALGLASLAAILSAGAVPHAAGAQVPFHPGVARQESVTVVLSGAADVALDRRLALLLREHPAMVTTDVRLPPNDTIRRSVLVLDATIVVEGVIEGDLVIVDGGAFVRPSAVVRGDIVNIAGGLYRSELSRISGRILDLPAAAYRVVREPEHQRIVIRASARPSPIELDGYMGLHVPDYDRVNGVTAVWGARYRFPLLGNVTPSVHAQGGWMTGRGEPEYEADVSAHWVGARVGAGYEHGWATHDRWIRGDLQNSLDFLWDGDDLRDYYAVNRAWGRVAKEFGDVDKSLYAVLSVTGQAEDARSLQGGQPWTLWGDSARANPSILEGRTTSAIAAVDLEWRGQQSMFDGRLEYERAQQVVGGDFAFDRVAVRGEWAMHALFRHTLEIETYVQTPIGGRPLPPQRWSFVGGSGTLLTLPVAAQIGDHVVFVESRYIIPLPRTLALPVLGAPDFELIHAAGSAWTSHGEGDFQQEVGARLQFPGVYVRYMIQPTDLAVGRFDLALSWPFGTRHPWQR